MLVDHAEEGDAIQTIPFERTELRSDTGRLRVRLAGEDRGDGGGVVAAVFAVVGVFVFGLQYAFKKIRPIFRERGKINAEVTGRLTESLGGVRVVKGYHAEAREAEVFAGGVERLLQNVLRSLTATSLMSLSSHSADGKAGVFYDASREGVSARQEVAEWAKDRHHFRVIISPERGGDIPDMTAYVREVMARVEKDLVASGAIEKDTKLHWIAINHHNTDNPHAHVVLLAHSVSSMFQT